MAPNHESDNQAATADCKPAQRGYKKLPAGPRGRCQLPQRSQPYTDHCRDRDDKHADDHAYGVPKHGESLAVYAIMRWHRPAEHCDERDGECRSWQCMPPRTDPSAEGGPAEGAPFGSARDRV